MARNRYTVEQALNSSKSVNWKVAKVANLPHADADADGYYDIQNIDISGHYHHILFNVGQDVWIMFAKNTDWVWNGKSDFYPGGQGIFLPKGDYLFPIPYYVDVGYIDNQTANTTNTDLGYVPEKVNPGDPLYLRIRLRGNNPGSKDIHYWLM